MRSVSDRLDVDRGEQTLVSIDTMSSVVRELPPSAFENLLVASPASPSKVERAIDAAGGDPGRCGHIPITGSPVSYDGELWTTKSVSPSDLTGISMRYSKAMRHVASGTGWFCFDNLQLLLMYAERDRVTAFISELTGRTRQREVTGVYGIARETVDDETYESLRGQFDGVVDGR